MSTGQVDKAFAELREILGDRATTSSVHTMATAGIEARVTVR